MLPIPLGDEFVTAVRPERAVEDYWDFSVHFVITPNGTIIQNHDEEVIAYGSHGFFKKRSVAVEFVGHFKRRIWRGKDQWGKSKKVKAHHVPTVQQIYSGRNLVSYLKRKLDINYVFAHAQAVDKNCPGPEIWFNVGEWAIKNGLSANGRLQYKATGGPIPRDWQKEKYDLRNFLSSPEF